MNLYWPIALIVLSNVFYHVCSKQLPADINPFAALTVTYLVGAVASTVMYYALNRGGNLLQEYQHLNWTSFVLGLAIVGLEVGSVSMYKVGWSLNAGQLVCSAILAIALLLVGYLFYREAITWTKVAGIAVCLAGLALLSK